MCIEKESVKYFVCLAANKPMNPNCTCWTKQWPEFQEDEDTICGMDFCFAMSTDLVKRANLQAGKENWYK